MENYNKYSSILLHFFYFCSLNNLTISYEVSNKMEYIFNESHVIITISKNQSDYNICDLLNFWKQIVEKLNIRTPKKLQDFFQDCGCE